MTDAQRDALREFMLLTEARKALNWESEMVHCRVPVNRQRADAIMAVADEVRRDAEDALDAVLKAFGC